MRSALDQGAPVTLDGIDTLADGLAPIRAGDLTFAHARELLDDVILVDDDAILRATAHLIKRRKRRGEFRVVGSQQEPDWLAQIVDGLWEMGETERRFPERFKAVGDDIVRIPQDDHPLWRPGACKCPHCEDMRTGASGMVCHCEHCYTQGYWKQKDLSSLIHLL